MAEYLDRPPRIQPRLPQDEREIPAPPKQENKQSWMQMALPLIMIIGYVMVAFVGGGGAQRLVFMVPMAGAVLASVGVSIYSTFQAGRLLFKQVDGYKQQINQLRREMQDAHQEQIAFYEYNYPDPDTIKTVDGSQIIRGGSRLWERRSSDDDFGWIRLGRGTIPSRVIYFLKDTSLDNIDPDLITLARRLERDSMLIDDAPITVPLYQHFVDEQNKGNGSLLAKSTIGVSATQRQAYSFINSFIANIVTFHSPNDVMLYVLGSKDSLENWQWAYDLKHCQIDPSRGQYRLYFEDSERRLSEIDGVLSEVHVNLGESFTVLDANTEETRLLAVIDGIGQDAGQKQYIWAQHNGRVQYVVERGSEVKRGQLIIRTQEFDIPQASMDEEISGENDIQMKMGRERQQRDIAGIPRFWKDHIWRELDQRSRMLRDRDDDEGFNVKLPFMIIIADLLHLVTDEQSWLNDLESEAAIALLMSQARELGASIIFLCDRRTKVPSGCQTVIELKQDAQANVRFLYAETGVNSLRYVGDADVIVPTMDLKNHPMRKIAQQLANWRVRQSYGADIPRSVDMLALYNASTIAEADIPKKWDQSLDAERADWVKMPLGMMAGQEPREIHFWADADGVHGMIAGATGSGKSELLMTMILSIAIKYDPRIVNFVLIDFKGGAAFEPFKELPHVVDIVTNLRGNAVERMFAAITAELNRRQHVNQMTDKKDIVRYRKDGLHLDPNRNDNYPHLFIIIDEFAEMIANNPEYKAQLDSITRLGRALGVTLILAAQRPTGITDQMRANIKFKLCLRVETKEESSEILSMPDGSYLPSIPGRGYMRIGSESLELIQVGYTGANYSNAPDYDPLEKYRVRDVIWTSDVSSDEDEPLYDVLVRRMDILTRQRYGEPENWRWYKPWPDPLPDTLFLNRPESIEGQYLNDKDQDLVNPEAVELVPSINFWLNDERTDWPDMDWDKKAMHTIAGIMDDPTSAQLRLLHVDFRRGHFAIVGASGYGKSVFMRSVITGLITEHSPEDLYIYILDFGGNRSLSIFENMQHVGGYILSHEEERIERLLSTIDQFIEERKEILSRYRLENVYDYNLRSDTETPLPAILVVLDNIAEFKENYEDLMTGTLIPLVREGLATGVHFMISGEQSSSFSKLFTLMTERITLRLSDEAEYPMIVGKGVKTIEEIPGRGYMRIGRTPLELQVALPFKEVSDDIGVIVDLPETNILYNAANGLPPILQKLLYAGYKNKYRRPPQIRELDRWLPHSFLRAEYVAQNPDVKQVTDLVNFGNPHFPVGLNDKLGVEQVVLERRAHFIVTGPATTAKTTTLHAWILYLAQHYPPTSVIMALIDLQGGVADYGGNYRLDELPHVVQPVIREKEDLESFIKHLENEYVGEDKNPKRHIYIFIDNYNDFDELTGRSYDKLTQLRNIARRAINRSVHFVLCGSREAFSSQDDLIRAVNSSKYGISTDAETATGAPFYANMPRSYSKMILPQGRAFLVEQGQARLTQLGVPYDNENTRVEELDSLVYEIKTYWKVQGMEDAEWEPLIDETAEAAEGKKSPSVADVKQVTELTPEQADCIIAKLAEANGIEDMDMARMSFYGTEDDENLIEMAKGFGIDYSDCL